MRVVFIFFLLIFYYLGYCFLGFKGLVDWETKAQRFYRNALLSFENSIYDIACFSAHQAVELLLKGIIVEKTGSKPFTHSLVELGRILEDVGLRLTDTVKRCLRELSKHYT